MVSFAVLDGFLSVFLLVLIGMEYLLAKDFFRHPLYSLFFIALMWPFENEKLKGKACEYFNGSNILKSCEP